MQHDTPSPSSTRRVLWLATALLMLAALLRGAGLMHVPPGLTHDEAGHGHDAAFVLRGVTPVYFSVGYGREPLYDYLNAALMSVLGTGWFTLRVSAWLWGILAVAVTFAVNKKLFGPKVALWATALMSISFWAVATGRQALRSGMLPFWLGLAVLGFTWRKSSPPRLLLAAVLITFGVGASLYTYIPARVLWLIFPLALLGTLRKGQPPPWGAWFATALGLIGAAALASPLFAYLRQYPATEARLSMLDAPIDALLAGDPLPILQNIGQTVLAFFWPGAGDSFLAYNIPGRPLFDPLTFVLLLVGILALLTGLLVTKRRAPTILALAWLGLGIAPSLVTGPAALFTRIIGAQTVIYALPALGFLALQHWTNLGWQRRWTNALAATGLAATMLITSADYFIRWGQSPDVRAAYQNTFITMAQQTGSQPALLSTVYPGVAHDPYIARLVRPEGGRMLYADMRGAIVVPPVPTLNVVFSTAATPAPVFAQALASLSRTPPATVNVPGNALDPQITLATINAEQLFAFQANIFDEAPTDTLNGALQLLDARWVHDTPLKPGGTASLLTVWLVVSPHIGPPVPPANLTDMVLFTHVLGNDSQIVAQRDRLDAPSWQWRPGDLVMQIHELPLPPDIAPGHFDAVVGLYDRASGVRARTGEGRDVIPVMPLNVSAND